MAINLITKYADKLAMAYTQKSLIKGKTSTEWSWDGASSVKILSIVTQAPGDYTRSGVSRYGTPADLQDTVQEIKIAQDKAFAMVIDKGDNTQQGMLKQAGKALNAEIEEQMVPLMDKYALLSFARGAGTKITTYTSLSKTNILEALTAIETAFSDAFIPNDNRFVFMSNASVALFRQSLMNCDTITDRLLLKGVVGDFGTLHIVGVPASWLPSNTLAIAFQQKSVVFPEQISDAKIHQDPPGISGHLLEGRYLYDAAVVKAFEKGVVVLGSSTTNEPGKTEATATYPTNHHTA